MLIGEECLRHITLIQYKKKTYLKDLYNTVVLKDIIEKNNIKDINLLNRIIQFIMGNIGGVISANSITNFF